jgi:hypothetical protein
MSLDWVWWQFIHVILTTEGAEWFEVCLGKKVSEIPSQTIAGPRDTLLLSQVPWEVEIRGLQF